MPSSHARPGFLITAPPSVSVPDVIDVLAVWIKKQKLDKLKNERKKERNSLAWRFEFVETFIFGWFIWTPQSLGTRLCVNGNSRKSKLVCVPDEIGALAVWRQNNPKKNVQTKILSQMNF